MLSADDIRRMAISGEDVHTEFKMTVPSKVCELTEEVCAFANTESGYLVIGVDDSGKIVGVDVDNRKRSVIQSSIGEISPHLDCDMYPVYVDSREVFVIDVPSGANKPYVFSGAVYKREEANSQKLRSADDIREAFQYGNKIYFDYQSCPSFKEDEIDSEMVARFRKSSEISEVVSDSHVLHNMHLYTEDGIPTSALVLCFGRNVEDFYPNAFIKCVLYEGNDKVYIKDYKKIGGNLLRQYDGAFDWLRNNLKVRYEIEDGNPRREVWEIPLSSLKEALVNAICHRDYYEMGATVTVEIFDDRVEISNPGRLLPYVADGFGHRSLARNPLIFTLFSRMNLAEAVATGIPRMKSYMVKAGLKEPVFKANGFFTVIFYKRNEAVGVKQDARRPVQQSKKREKGAPTLEELIELIREDESISRKEMSRRLGVSLSTVSRMLNSSRDRIRYVGPSKGGHWEILQ